jgi:hypothetical protein
MQSTDIKRILDKHPYLIAPESLIRDLENLEFLSYINGCGSANGLASTAPSTIDNICILAACIIHDARYYAGETIEDKIMADIELLTNIISIIKNSPDFYTVSEETRQYRIDSAVTYFRFVHEYGLKAFVAGKNISIIATPLLVRLTSSMILTWKAILIPFKLILNTLLIRIHMFGIKKFRILNN